jgi:hypothetical protein
VGLTGGSRGLLSKSKFNSKDFKLNSACSNLIQSKQDLPWLEKFEIKYGCEGFDVRNNFLIGTSLDSKLILNKKLGKLLGFEFDRNLRKFSLDLKI